MAVLNQATPATKRAFIGKAWINTVKKEGANKGKQFLNLKFDRGTTITLSDADAIQLWPNHKREGIADADYRASVQVVA